MANICAFDWPSLVDTNKLMEKTMKQFDTILILKVRVFQNGMPN